MSLPRKSRPNPKKVSSIKNCRYIYFLVQEIVQLAWLFFLLPLILFLLKLLYVLKTSPKIAIFKQ